MPIVDAAAGQDVDGSVYSAAFSFWTCMTAAINSVSTETPLELK